MRQLPDLRMLTMKSTDSPGSALVFETYPSMAEDRTLRFNGYEAKVIGSSNSVRCNCHALVPGLLFSGTIGLWRLADGLAVAAPPTAREVPTPAPIFKNCRRPR